MAEQTVFESSLKNPITYLHEYHQQPVVVLIDEYDSPMIEAWDKEYYPPMADFMRAWLGGGLKHVEGAAVYRSVVTGILRIAKESIFSGLNNLKVWSTLIPGPFADKFGFTEPESIACWSTSTARAGARDARRGITATTSAGKRSIIPGR